MKNVSLFLTGLVLFGVFALSCEREITADSSVEPVLSTQNPYQVAAIDSDGNITMLWDDAAVVASFGVVVNAPLQDWDIVLAEDEYYLSGFTADHSMYRKLVKDNHRLIATGGVTNCTTTDCFQCQKKGAECICKETNSSYGCKKSTGDYDIR